MDVADRLRDAGASLTVTERRIADVLLRSPHEVAFGTVAQVAEIARAGTASVVRLAAKLGFDGYADLQRTVQAEMTGRLGPAATRIRVLDDAALIERQGDVEQRNVQATYAAIDADTLAAVVELLGDGERPVLVLSGSASRGVALQFVHDLGLIRGDVALLDGNPIDVLRAVSLASSATVVMALDLRRYDRWLVDALAVIGGRAFDVVAVSDSVLSPLSRHAAHSFVVTADSVGPFDSHVGTLALLDLLVAEVAHRHRATATERLDRLEAAWTEQAALDD